MKLTQTVAASALCLAMIAPAMADTHSADDMKKLALQSGCLTCHSIESGKPGPNGQQPIGPAWEDVSVQYAGKPGAQDFLTRVVLEGSNPYSSHWKGKVSGLSMPPNAVAITEGNARLLVSWILSLKK
ncbi:MAG: c-type cytochrome [Rhodocyclaceae bacterium]|nr:c-type cytochrome [Rhodocyclaceae bacterium]MCB1963942.1 c-type cytochrome [Rhodocyclaceae bacterium]